MALYFLYSPCSSPVYSLYTLGLVLWPPFFVNRMLLCLSKKKKKGFYNLLGAEPYFSFYRSKKKKKNYALVSVVTLWPNYALVTIQSKYVVYVV